MTTDCIVKLSPVGSLAAWHSTQYVEKKPIPQLAHVSPEPSGDGASCAPGASASLESKAAASFADAPESLEPPAAGAAEEHAEAPRANKARRRDVKDAILRWPRGFDHRDQEARAVGCKPDSSRPRGALVRGWSDTKEVADATQPWRHCSHEINSDERAAPGVFAVCSLSYRACLHDRLSRAEPQLSRSP